jgi:hypothetical protein
MRRVLRYIALCFLAAGFITCKKIAEKPPVADSLGHKIYSVSELKAIANCANCSKSFTGDVYFIGVVIGDAQSGNFYKELYLRDRYNTGGIHLDLTQASSFWVGDSVRVNLKGLNVSINSSTGILEIDTLDWEKYCVKFATGGHPQPHALTISQYTSNLNTYLGDLIQLTSVAFTSGDAGQYWADAPGGNSLNRTLQDCLGAQLIVRTSNYANFADDRTPTGNGSIIGIGTAYQGTGQIEIRRPSEAVMNGAGCTVYLKKDFNDSKISNTVIPSENWSVVSVVNAAVSWTPASFSVDKFAKVSGFISGNTNSECWMISPPMDLSNSTDPILSFRTAAKFAGDTLEVRVCTNYVSGPPVLANWAQLTGIHLSPNNPGSYVWTQSGNISLNAFKSASTRIAYRYKSSTAGSTTYEVDDVLVKEN